MSLVFSFLTYGHGLPDLPNHDGRFFQFHGGFLDSLRTFLRLLDELDRVLPASEPHAASPFLALDEVIIIYLILFQIADTAILSGADRRFTDYCSRRGWGCAECSGEIGLRCSPGNIMTCFYCFVDKFSLGLPEVGSSAGQQLPGSPRCASRCRP